MRGLQKCVRNWNPDGFLSYLQDSTAKPAHLAALFYHVLLYPQKAILEIWITFYFCHHFLIIGYFKPGLFNYELFSSQDSTLMLKSAWLIRPELKLSVRNILQPIVSSRQKRRRQMLELFCVLFLHSINISWYYRGQIIRVFSGDVCRSLRNKPTTFPTTFPTTTIIANILDDYYTAEHISVATL